MCAKREYNTTAETVPSMIERTVVGHKIATYRFGGYKVAKNAKAGPITGIAAVGFARSMKNMIPSSAIIVNAGSKSNPNSVWLIIVSRESGG